MTTKNNQPDNEVYILGSETQNKKNKITPKGKWIIFSGICLAVILIVASIILLRKEQTPEYYFEPENTVQESTSIAIDSVANDSNKDGYTEMVEESINDVPLYVYIPHNANISLSVGLPDKSDSTIVFAAMAADIRKDNQAIVGDFVLSGKQLSRGTAKKGFCAINKTTFSIGTGESTPLLEEMIKNKGSFFRQYPLVGEGELFENKPKGKSIRRALAIRNDQIIMVESKNNESFHDFSQALIDIGVSDAIYLVGGDAFGWRYDKEHIRHEFGKEQPNLPPTISYIIWRIE